MGKRSIDNGPSSIAMLFNNIQHSNWGWSMYRRLTMIYGMSHSCMMATLHNYQRVMIFTIHKSLHLPSICIIFSMIFFHQIYMWLYTYNSISNYHLYIHIIFSMVLNHIYSTPTYTYTTGSIQQGDLHQKNLPQWPEDWLRRGPQPRHQLQALVDWRLPG